MSDLTAIFPSINAESLCTATLNKWDESRGIFLIGGKYYETHEAYIHEAYRIARLLNLSLLAVSDTDTQFILHFRNADDLFILNSLLTGNDKGEFSFNIDLPRHIINMKLFQRNFELICRDKNIMANFEMDTSYIRRLRVTTNNTDDMIILKRFYAQGAFNVGLNHKAVLTLPEFRT